MNKEQFIYWLKGYTAGHEHAPTLKQWETIVSELNKIKDCPDYGSLIGEAGSGTSYNTPGIITNGNTSWTNLPKGTNVSYTSN
jgi:hypothetical protein